MTNAALKIESTTTRPLPWWKLPEPQKDSFADRWDEVHVYFHEVPGDTAISVNVGDLRYFIENYARLVARRKHSDEFRYQVLNSFCSFAGVDDLWTTLAKRHNAKRRIPSYTASDAKILNDLREIWNLISTSTPNAEWVSSQEITIHGDY